MSTGQDHAGQEDEEVRKRMRVIKNRLSAKRSREQARDYVQQLESSLAALMHHNESLARRLAFVECDNATLRQHLFFGSLPPTPPTQNPIDQPAALVSKSQQMDMVLVLCALVAWLIGLTPAPLRNPEPSWEPLPRRAALPAQSPGARPGARRLRRFLRRAAQLGRFDHLCGSLPQVPPAISRQATSAAA